jgi:uncharacterized protein
MGRLFGFALLFAAAAAAQAPVPRVPHIRAVGSAVVSVKPDQARLEFAVVTQAAAAAQAAAANAKRTTAVIEALKKALGPGATIRTTQYSVSPNYNHRDGGRILTGFTAQNAVEVIVNDLDKLGSIIDTGLAAGANRIDGVRMMLKNDEPARREALRLAGQQGRARAEAIASGLNAKLGALVSAEENLTGGPRPLMYQRTEAAALAAPTPIETGSIDVEASVAVEYEAVQ